MGLGIRKFCGYAAQKAAAAFGFDLVERTFRNNPDLRLGKLLEHHAIDLVFDVGANIGQYGARLRSCGYAGRIVSFEPLSTAFSVLGDAARRDGNWMVVNAALGQADGTAELNISGNSQSSSLLTGLPRLVNAAPKAGVVGREKVEVKALDSVFAEFDHPDEKIFLKIDAQGYEQQVLAGATKSLHRIAGIQLETPLVELYAGEMLFRETLDHLASLGFSLCSLEPGFTDRATGQLLEVDCIFFRTDESGAMAPAK